MFVGRGKNKVHPDYGINDIYKFYKENAKNPVSAPKFKKVWIDSINQIIKLIVYRNVDYNIPARLGTLCARKLIAKPIIKEDGTVLKNRMGINYKASWAKWLREYPDLTPKEIAKVKGKTHVYYLNEHTDGFKVKWKWDKYLCTVKNQIIYSLQLTRENKEKLSNAFSKLNIDYYEYSRK